MFLVAGQAIGVILLFARPRLARVGRIWLAVLTLIYVVLSLQVTNDFLNGSLTYGAHRLRPGEVKGVDTIVVLSNGVHAHRGIGQAFDTLNTPSAFNALEGARMYRMLQNPTVLVSGGYAGVHDTTPDSDIMTAALVQLGVPADRIAVAKEAADTHEQVRSVTDWLGQHRVDRFVLVTAPEHMRRAAMSFRASGLQPILARTTLRYQAIPPTAWPNHWALEGSESALYEYLGVIYYKMRGWI